MFDFVFHSIAPSLDNRKTTHPLFVMPLLDNPQRFGFAVEQPDDADRASFKVLPVHVHSQNLDNKATAIQNVPNPHRYIGLLSIRTKFAAI
jgi:hypothetical protein